MVTLEARSKRHEVRAKAFEAFEALQGRQGLSKDEQVAAFETAAKALDAAADLAREGAKLAKERDFEAHQAEKASFVEGYVGDGSAEAELYANEGGEA